jgi:hypothetical protein
LLLTVTLLSTTPVAAEQTNAAGLVIRHGDGTIIYAYVQFDGDSITSEDLLTRSGLEVIITPFGGLGAGVCTIDGEGCPASNCYCKSYTSPAYYWHYYTLQNTGWREELSGPSSRTMHDGDIDGWSWTTRDPDLPAVTIEDIATRTSNAETASPATPTTTPEPDTTATTYPTITPSPGTTTRAVVISPDGTPVPLTVDDATSGTDNRSLLIFGSMAGIVVVVGAFVVLRKRGVV